MMAKKRELVFSIKRQDLKMQTFRAGGKGGQHQNTTDSGVRIIHEPSGARGESRTERSQWQNKRLALQRLTQDQRFKTWVSQRLFELTGGKTLDERVDEMMEDENLLIEGVNEQGDWERLD